MPKLFRITTVPLSLQLLLTGQMRYMREQGFDVLMISADGRELPAVLENEGCPHIIVPMTREITPWQDARCLWQLIRLMRQEKPDIVHSHTPKAGLLGMLAAKIAGVPVRIHTVAGMPLMTSTGMKRSILEMTEKLTYWAANHVWPNSKSLLNFITEQKFCPPKKLSMIASGSSNGIDLDRYNPAAIKKDRLEAIKTDLAYDTSLTYLLFVGRIVADKGIPEFIEAFQQISPEYPALRLILLGDFEAELDALPAHIMDAIKKNPHIRHISWSPFVEYYMSLADILVHPSHREGFPNVLLQAGALKCPIVCSAIVGNVDIVENNNTGLMFQVKDSADLARQLRFALDHKAHIQELSENLYSLIVRQFNRKRLHKEILENYMNLCSMRNKNLPLK